MSKYNLSAREAERLGIKRVKIKKKSSKKSSKDEKKAKKKVTKYYKEKKTDVEKQAETKTTRFQEDMDRILKEAGIEKTRAMEDYMRNMKNIAANKSADVSDVNYYVKTQKGRTQEDLTTALAKEIRRYTLEQDQINQSLADAGLTFSERTPEKIAAGGTAETQKGIKTEAQRSFQDISRYEATKNRDIQLKYGQLEEEAGQTKTRTLEDILNAQAAEAQRIQRGKEDIAFGKATDIRDINYELADTKSDISNYYEAQKNTLKGQELKINVQGV